MSNIVWDSEQGWHDGPDATLELVNGHIVITPTPAEYAVGDKVRYVATAFLGRTGRVIAVHPASFSDSQGRRMEHHPAYFEVMHDRTPDGRGGNFWLVIASEIERV